MKDYVNLFYTIVEKIQKWDNLNKSNKTKLIRDFINIRDKNDLFANYLDKYRVFLSNNTLKFFTKDIIEFKF